MPRQAGWREGAREVSLNLPVLDDLTYADLVREAVELIPRYAPKWTNHNASDPGITLLELFAYLTEIYLYRIDRISDASKEKFVKLLVGPGVPLEGEDRERLLRHTVAKLRRPFRAVCDEDFERLTMEAVWHGGHGAAVARAHCFPRRNLEAVTETERRRDRPGHVSVVFVPSDSKISESDTQAITRTIKAYLEPRRLLTCRVHVVAPRYVDAAIRIRAAVAPWQAPKPVEDRIRNAVDQFFCPRSGEPDGSGWPLGRSVYTTDLYRRLATIDGVLRLTAVEWTVGQSDRLLRSETGEVVGVQLTTGELLRAHVNELVCEVLR
ncbi:MAG: hypothetical protein C5B57_06405 [Blastocatellia bacterium]|nr:MAG: hypothetical protein C5B57_06405 [Blastocatellia bacterium]